MRSIYQKFNPPPQHTHIGAELFILSLFELVTLFFIPKN